VSNRKTHIEETAMTADTELPRVPATDESEARQEFEQQAALLEDELRAGRITYAEYELRKSEAWEVYRARSGALIPDDERRSEGD
jgi:hypothetical protein